MLRCSLPARTLGRMTAKRRVAGSVGRQRRGRSNPGEAPPESRDRNALPGERARSRGRPSRSRRGEGKVRGVSPQAERRPWSRAGWLHCQAPDCPHTTTRAASDSCEPGGPCIPGCRRRTTRPHHGGGWCRYCHSRWTHRQDLEARRAAMRERWRTRYSPRAQRRASRG